MEPPGLLSEGLWPSSSRGGCSPDATAPAVSPHLFLQPPPGGQVQHRTPLLQPLLPPGPHPLFPPSQLGPCRFSAQLTVTASSRPSVTFSKGKGQEG